MVLKKLKSLSFYGNQISEIYFEWILFVNQNDIVLSLNANPIKKLPVIPENFDYNKVQKDKGIIRFQRGQIDPDDVKTYQSVFGKKFISI